MNGDPTQLLIWILLILLVFGPKVYHYLRDKNVQLLMICMKRITGRHILVLSHHQAGLFGEMITTGDLIEIERAIRKFKGKPFDFIINTLGGDVFASIKISKLIADYPSKVRVYVPKYAMSGGTLIALSGDELYMNKTSVLGPIDPQVGTLFKIFSERGWKEIIKRKKHKAQDESIAFSLLAGQISKSIKHHIRRLIKGKCKNPKKMEDLLIKGEVEHGFQIEPYRLAKMGYPINKIKLPYPDKIIEAGSKKNVMAV